MAMLFALVASVTFQATASDTLEAVDLYGLRTIAEPTVRAAIGLSPGDPLPASTDSVRVRLLRIPGVADVDVSVVCCGERGGALMYVGMREIDVPALTFRVAPTGGDRLPSDVIALGARADTALYDAVRRGVAGEDESRGYSLAADSVLRAVQEQFIPIAQTRFDLLVRVLRGSSDASHRALAAQIIAYAPNRHAVVRELGDAVRDASDDVRNNATRGLALLAGWMNEHPDSAVSIPGHAFINFLNSVEWSDRNKGVFVLMRLTSGRDPALLAELRSRALPSLVEMSRWTSAGHAFGAFIVLARTAGIEDGEIFQAWQNGDRESIIARATRPVGALRR